MKYLVHISLFLLLNIASTFVLAQDEQDKRLALTYYNQGEYDKALMYYERIYEAVPSYYNFTYLYNCYMELEQYKEAEKLAKKYLRKHPDELRVYVLLGKVYEVKGELEKAELQYKKAINSITRNTRTNKIQTLASQFEREGKIQFAIETYLQGNKVAYGNPYMYNHRIAQLYNRQGKTDLMIKTLLDLVDVNEGYLMQTQSGLNNSIDFSSEPKKVEALRKALLKKVQEHPNKPVYTELLAWFFMQKGDYKSALIHLKALDKREKGEGRRVYNLGVAAYNNKQSDTALEAYDYVLSLPEDGRYYRAAKNNKLKTLKAKITEGRAYTREEVLSLRADYEDALRDLGKNAYSLELVKDLAKLNAYYLDEPETARLQIEEALTFSGLSTKEKAKLKVLLADILVLLDDVWDASLLYMQVEKQFKEEPIGHEAKFKNARIYYYTGEFAWAKAQLDVLKASTSKLIANDAMDLSLLITENTGLDTTERPMQLFARADLLIVQHKYDSAELYFDSIEKEFPYHPLADEILWKKHEIAKSKGDIQGAIKYLEQIALNYKEDVLADNALYEMAQLYENYLDDKETAKAYYKQLLFEYPGSLFLVEARKKYRELSGK